MSRAERLEKMVEVMGGYVGPHMGRAALTAQAASLGLDLAALGPGDLVRLVHKVEVGLRLFIGPEKAAEVGVQLRSLANEGPE